MRFRARARSIGGTRLGKTKDKIETRVKSQADHDAAMAQAHGTATAPVGSPQNPSNAILTVANVITACRFVLTIVFLWMFVSDMNRYVALAFYAVAAVTDFLDGQVARRTQTVSWVGKVMDPIMDRVLLFTGVLGLIITGELPVWVACFVIGRDVYLFLGGLRLQHYRRRPVDVVFVGKAATALLMFGFCDLLLGLPVVRGLGVTSLGWLPGLNHDPACMGIFFVYAGLLCSLLAVLEYTRTGIAIRRDALASRAEDGEGR